MHKLNLIKLDATTSTNDMIRKGYSEGTYSDGDLVWTTNQTKGRGQRKKSWHSEPGKNLAFSICKAFKQLDITNAFLISQVVSFAMVEVLNSFQLPNVKIKWPNDIMSDSSKIGGILIENILQGNRLVRSIIGVGLNINQTQFDQLPNATSMALVGQQHVDPETVLHRVVTVLEKQFPQCIPSHAASIRNQFIQHLYGLNTSNNFKRNTTQFKAVIKGVSKEGHLLVVHENGQLEQLRYPEVKMSYQSP